MHFFHLSSLDNIHYFYVFIRVHYSHIPLNKTSLFTNIRFFCVQSPLCTLEWPLHQKSPGNLSVLDPKRPPPLYICICDFDRIGHFLSVASSSKVLDLKRTCSSRSSRKNRDTSHIRVNF